MDIFQINYIKDNFDKMSVEDLRKNFNNVFKTDYKTTAFHYHTKKLGLEKHKEHKYTNEEELFLKNNSSFVSREDLCKLFNVMFDNDIKLSALTVHCINKGYKAMSDGKFVKGSVPWCKSKGGRDEYVKKLKGGNSSSFCKGNIPFNTIELGSIVKRNRGYFVKTVNGFVSYNRYIWESKYGLIGDKNLKVLSVYGNELENDINNLRLVNNNVQIFLMSNKWNDKGAEIFDAGVKYAELVLALNMR